LWIAANGDGELLAALGRSARPWTSASASGWTPGAPRAEEVFRSHVGTGDRADRTGYLRGTVKDARKMVGEFRAFGCTRLSIAFRNGPYDWDVLEAFGAEIVREGWQGELMLNPGDKAPDFTGRDHHGNTVKLSDFKGKTVVLWFYPKADTPGWTAEGCGFRDLKAEYDRKNAVILGASFDSAADNKKFAEKFNFNFPLICDTDRTIGTAYGANTDPQKGAARVGVVIDRDGKIKEWHARVDARAWPAEVVKTL
jgi:thioredoxin-dependent peroxiredoxin